MVFNITFLSLTFLIVIFATQISALKTISGYRALVQSEGGEINIYMFNGRAVRSISTTGAENALRKISTGGVFLVSRKLNDGRTAIVPYIRQ